MENKSENQEQKELKDETTEQKFSSAPNEGEEKKDIKYRSYTMGKRLGIKRQLYIKGVYNVFIEPAVKIVSIPLKLQKIIKKNKILPD